MKTSIYGLLLSHETPHLWMVFVPWKPPFMDCFYRLNTSIYRLLRSRSKPPFLNDVFLASRHSFGIRRQERLGKSSWQLINALLEEIIRRLPECTTQELSNSSWEPRVLEPGMIGMTGIFEALKYGEISAKHRGES